MTDLVGDDQKSHFQFLAANSEEGSFRFNFPWLSF